MVNKDKTKLLTDRQVASMMRKLERDIAKMAVMLSRIQKMAERVNAEDIIIVRRDAFAASRRALRKRIGANDADGKKKRWTR